MSVNINGNSGRVIIDRDTCLVTVAGGGPQGLRGEKGETGNRGVTMIGPYAAGYSYSDGDGVSYLGSSWVSLHDSNQGNTPAEGAHWTLLADAGIVSVKLDGRAGGQTVCGGTEANDALTLKSTSDESETGEVKIASGGAIEQSDSTGLKKYSRCRLEWPNGACDGTYGGYILLAKAYTAGKVANSEICGMLTLSRGGTTSRERADVFEVVSKSAYQTETFVVNHIGSAGISFFEKLCKITYNDVIYHAIKLTNYGGEANNGLYFDGYASEPPVLIRSDAGSSETDFGAPTANCVTNGDSHDHSGGDGAQIAYANLGGLPTIPSSADLGGGSESVGGAAANGSATTFARSDHKHAITNPALDTLAACTDITTRNASTSAHGLLRKLDNVSTHFLNGQGVWATPAGDGAALPFVTVGPTGCDYTTDGTADQTEINTALATGKEVYLIGSVYISGPINITLGNNLRGIPSVNRYHNSIIYVTADINAITVGTTGGAVVQDLYINSSVSSERNGWAIYATVPLYIRGICTNYMKNGFYLTTANESRITDCFLLLCTGTNIALNNASEIYMQDVMMEGWTSATTSTKGLYVYGGTINVYADSCQFMHTGRAFYIDGLMSGRFSQCYFDSYSYTALITGATNVVRAVSFDNCWFAMATGLVDTVPAILITGSLVRDVSFSDCYVRDTPADAIRVAESAHNISFSNMHFCEIGYYTSASCISLASTVSHVIVQGCMASEEGTSIAYGVYADNSTYVSTTGNDFVACTTPINNSGSHNFNHNMT